MSMANGNMRQGNRGFSLIELMVAMTVSLILLVGVGQIYLGTSATSRAQEGLSRVQENARFAVDSLSSDIRLAGYTGCPRSANAEPDRIMADRASDDMFSQDTFVRGTDDGSSSDLWEGDPPGNAIADIPAIRVTFAGTSQAVAEDDSFNGANFDLERNPDGFTQGDIITITDCSRTEIAEISNMTNSNKSTSINVTHGGNVNTPHNDLDSDDFSGETKVMRTYQYVYYVGTNSVGNPALYRRDLAASDDNDRSIELVDNVETMRIQYGLDTDDDLQTDVYRPAEDLSSNDWSTVASVRVSLLLRSGEVLTEQRPTQFSLLGDNLNHNDRRVRQVATKTITLRNRLP